SAALVAGGAASSLDGESQRLTKAGSAGCVHVLHPLRFCVVVNEPIPTLQNSILGNRWFNLINPRLEKTRPVVRLDLIQCLDQIIQRVCVRNVASVVDSI